MVAVLLKHAQYSNWGWPIVKPQYCEVVYVVIGGKCIFTGTTNRYVTSTINAAEDVISAIAEKEGLELSEIVFYDLQTYRTYRKRPGQFQFDRVEFDIKKGEPVNPRWIPEECPDEIIELFRRFIGEPEPQTDLS